MGQQFIASLRDGNGIAAYAYVIAGRQADTCDHLFDLIHKSRHVTPADVAGDGLNPLTVFAQNLAAPVGLSHVCDVGQSE